MTIRCEGRAATASLVYPHRHSRPPIYRSSGCLAFAERRWHRRPSIRDVLRCILRDTGFASILPSKTQHYSRVITATEDALMQVGGVGPKKAARIRQLVC
jgi:hypothetical protein